MREAGCTWLPSRRSIAVSTTSRWAVLVPRWRGTSKLCPCFSRNRAGVLHLSRSLVTLNGFADMWQVFKMLDLQKPNQDRNMTTRIAPKSLNECSLLRLTHGLKTILLMKPKSVSCSKAVSFVPQPHHIIQMNMVRGPWSGAKGSIDNAKSIVLASSPTLGLPVFSSHRPPSCRS